MAISFFNCTCMTVAHEVGSRLNKFKRKRKNSTTRARPGHSRLHNRFIAPPTALILGLPFRHMCALRMQNVHSKCFKQHDSYASHSLEVTCRGSRCGCDIDIDELILPKFYHSTGLFKNMNLSAIAALKAIHCNVIRISKLP